MKINKVLAELESLVANSKEDEDKAQRIGYQIEEYKRQEKSLNETIEKQRQDLSDYISMKMARLEALTEMSEAATVKRLELESTLEILKPTDREGQ